MRQAWDPWTGGEGLRALLTDATACHGVGPYGVSGLGSVDRRGRPGGRPYSRDRLPWRRALRCVRPGIGGPARKTSWQTLQPGLPANA